MFTLIKNYKTLLSLYLMNNFAPDAPGQVSDGNGFKEENGTNIDDLVQNILSDERIDDADKDYLVNLEKELNSDKNEIYKATKEKTKLIMNDILKEVLENGFHIKNEASLVSLQKMASISGMDLPDLSKEIGSRITKDQDSDTVYLYNEGLISMGSDLADFQYNKVDGKYVKVRSGEKINVSYNDNEFKSYQRAAAVHLDANSDKVKGDKIIKEQEKIDLKNKELGDLIVDLNSAINGVEIKSFDEVLAIINNNSDYIGIDLTLDNGTAYSLDKKILIVKQLINIVTNSATGTVSSKTEKTSTGTVEEVKKEATGTVSSKTGKTSTGTVEEVKKEAIGTVSSKTEKTDTFKSSLNSAKEFYSRTNVTNEQMKKIQEAVGLKGDDVDGKFGKDTFKAIVSKQKELGLVPDGKVGSKTLAKLNIANYNESVSNIKEDAMKTTESSERLEIPGDSKITIPENLAELVSKGETVPVGKYIDDSGEPRDILLKVTGGKYMVELDRSRIFDLDTTFTMDGVKDAEFISKLKTNIQEKIKVVIKEYKEDDLKGNNSYELNSNLDLNKSEIKELDSVGVDYEDTIKDGGTTYYKLDRDMRGSNDFLVAKTDKGFTIKDVDGKINPILVEKGNLKDVLVKTDKVLNLISKVDSRLTPDDNEYTKDETILKGEGNLAFRIIDKKIQVSNIEGNAEGTFADLNITSKNIDKIIKDLEFALGSDSEKEEIKANEKLGLSEKDIADLKELGIDYEETSEQGVYKLDRKWAGSNDFYIKIEENNYKISDDDGSNLKLDNVSDLVSTLKTADVYLTKISDAKRLSNNEILVKYLDGLEKPITNTVILETIVNNLNDESSMEAEINKREEVEKAKEKAILDAIDSIKGDLTKEETVKIEGEGEYSGKEYKLEFKLDGNELTLDSKWNQPGSDKSALITNTDKSSMLLLKESLIKEYKEEVTKVAKIKKDMYGRAIED